MPSRKTKHSDIIEAFKPAQLFERPPRGLILRTLIVPAFLGFLAGLTATVFVSGFLAADFFDGAPEKVLAPSMKDLAKEDKEAEIEQKVFDRLSSNVVEVYKRGKAKDTVLSSENFLSLGAALTSDGWIASVFDSAIDANSVGVVWNNRFYPSEKTVRDPFTSLVFLKIQAAGLPLAPFAKSAPQKGSEVFVGGAAGSVYFSHIHNLRGNTSPQAIRSSETLDMFVLIDNFSAGAPVFNSKGELAGISKGGGQMIKSSFMEDSLKKILKEGAINRPSLGVFYVDLSSSPQADAPRLGAKLTASKETKALLKGSPAEKAGLKEGDIIISVDKFELNQNQTLAEVIAGFAPGTKLALTILREDKEEKIEVVLGESK